MYTQKNMKEESFFCKTTNALSGRCLLGFCRARRETKLKFLQQSNVLNKMSFLINAFMNHGDFEFCLDISNILFVDSVYPMDWSNGAHVRAFYF